MTKQRNYFAVFVLGKDNPGIVANISKALYEIGANINDSSHTIIGNQFAMLLLIALESNMNEEQLRDTFNQVMGDLGLTVHVHKITDKDINRRTSDPGQLCVIHLYGADKPGIVYQVTDLLSQYKINITDLSTRRFGTEENPIYIMYLEADVPNDVNTIILGQQLNEIASRLNVEIKYELEEVASL